MAKHLNGIVLDQDEVSTVINALHARRRDLERAMANAERKGFSPPPGKVDVNKINLVAVDKALAAIKKQTRNIEDKS